MSAEPIPPASDVPVCPRHPDRESWVRCQRCERPVCPQCQRPAAVGVQCVDCVAEAARTVRAPRTTFGGALRTRDTAVTKVLIAACLVAFAGQYVLPPQVYAWLPLVNGPYENAFGPGTWWQPLTSAFLHGGLLHLLLNTYALWITGQYLEPILGRLRFTALYVLSALGGAAGALLLPFTAYSVLVGASGAIFGLFAALFVVNRHLGRQTGQIVGLIVVNFAIGVLVAGISWQAHLGGLLTGAAVSWVLARGRRGDAVLQWSGLAVVAVVLVALLGYAATRSPF
ncbi:rhomboid family intramembrane serine protease [Kineococcus sp. SYSU DK006]|uniref:rhomboid family intramembrane serine protease n=1 Tax=Kineococcus sp. SYSU DK006 TaxID=3383127 RepID=UPI003D7E7B73